MAQDLSEQVGPPEPAGGATPAPGVIHLWNRSLDHYPDDRPRYLYLLIVVIATIMLYYEFYVPASVGPSIISHFHETFRFYVFVVAGSNLVGAFASLIAGLADRWGRANITAYGLAVTGLLVLFGLPNAPDKWSFLVMYSALGFVEGMILVTSPALVRDFSPQLGRASAMGFWTLGPVIGSLVVAEVSSHTLSHLKAWQDQFTICGIAGVAVAVISILFLKELSPRLRDQLMVSIRERALVEARAQGVDISHALEHPWRQVLHLDVIGSAVGISVFLLIYYAATGFFVIYFTTIFGFTQQQANGIGNWFWAFDAGALVLVGLVSDRLRVRKPLMVVGAVGAIASTIVFLTRATHPHTSYYTLVAIVSVLAAMLGVAFAPWMAAFTETVERRNPALTATGLAIWGWVIRVVVAGSTFILPFVVNSTTPLVTYGAQVQALATRYAPELATAGAVDPATLATLSANPSDPAAGAKAVAEIVQKQHVTPSQAIQDLLALAKVPKADLAFLQAHGSDVQTAAKASPAQWQHWFWVCIGGQVLFLPLIFLLTGRWSPKRAREDEEQREEQVRLELERLAKARGAVVA